MHDTSMFNFLFGNNNPKSKSDLDYLNELSKQATYAYFGKEQVPLHLSITKTAKLEKLTPEQIEIVCQGANKQVHAQMFKTASNKYTTFDLADSKKIVEELEGTSKTANYKGGMDAENSFDTDYNLKPYEKVASVSSDFSICGLVTKTDNSPRVEAIKKAAFSEKVKLAQSKVADQIIATNNKIKTADLSFVKIARNMLLPYRIDARPNEMKKIAYVCIREGLGKEKTAKLLNSTKLVMEKQGLLEKRADLKVDESLISSALESSGVKVINGNHPLIITIKTIVDEGARKRDLESKYNQIQTEVQNYGGCQPCSTSSGNNYGAILDQFIQEL